MDCKKLNFDIHLKFVERKIAYAVGILNKLKCYFPNKILLQLYHALIYAHRLYAIPIWGSTYKSYLHKISILRNKVVRIGFPDKIKFQGKPIIYQPKGSMTTGCDKLTANNSDWLRRAILNILLSPEPSCPNPHFVTKSLLRSQFVRCQLTWLEPKGLKTEKLCLYGAGKIMHNLYHEQNPCNLYHYFTKSNVRHSCPTRSSTSLMLSYYPIYEKYETATIFCIPGW